MYTVKVQGETYLNFPSLVPNENGPTFFQLYFHGTANKTKRRMSIILNENLNEKIM